LPFCRQFDPSLDEIEILSGSWWDHLYCDVLQNIDFLRFSRSKLAVNGKIRPKFNFSVDFDPGKVAFYQKCSFLKNHDLNVLPRIEKGLAFYFS